LKVFSETKNIEKIVSIPRFFFGPGKQLKMYNCPLIVVTYMGEILLFIWFSDSGNYQAKISLLNIFHATKEVKI